MPLMDSEAEGKILTELKTAYSSILKLGPEETLDDLQRRAERTTMVEHRLRAKYKWRLVELAGEKLKELQSDAKFNLEDFLRVLMRMSYRFHVFVGSSQTEDDLNARFGRYSEALTPIVAAQLLKEIDEDVLHFVRESRDGTWDAVRESLTTETQRFNGLISAAQKDAP